MKRHDVKLDCLRVGGAFAVVWLHVSANVIEDNANVQNLNWWVGNFADALARWCVPIFVMVSGALLLSKSSEQNISNFYRRRVNRLFVPILFWTIFYSLFNAIYNGQSLDWIAVVKSVVRGEPYFHLWYLYMILGLYLFTPFLSQFVACSSPRSLNLFIAICFLISAIESIVGNLKSVGHATFLGLFPSFVCYFVAGYSLRTLCVTIKPIALIATAFACALTIPFGTGALFPEIGQRASRVMCSYQNPFVIIMSLSIFQLGIQSNLLTDRKLNVRLFKYIRHMGQLSLGIYVIHPLWRDVLSKWGMDQSFIFPAMGIPVKSLVVFLLSAATAALLGAIPLVKATVK